MRVWLFSVVLGLSVVVGSVLWLPIGRNSKQSELFPQNQECQPDTVALRIRFPYRRRHPQMLPLVPDPEPRTRAVTNCRRMAFQYFLKTLEVTHLHYSHLAGDIWKKLYALNSEGERDLIVHVSHVQPATSILDPTISTNLNLLAFAQELHRARAIGGNRLPLEGYDLDRFRPYQHSFERDDEFYFLSRPSASPEFVGRCRTASGGRGWCDVLVYSQQDGLAFAVIVPQAELGRLSYIIERSLGLLRNWRVQA